MSENSIGNGNRAENNVNDPNQPGIGDVDPGADGNNNMLPLNGNRVGPRSFLDTIGITKFPPASTIFSAILIIMYMITTYFDLNEKSILVSWDSVIVDGQYWRLLVAHLFHFNKVNLFVNCISLMTMGRYIEKRIKTVAMLSIIQFMGIVSNLIYIFINNFVSPNSAYSSTFGFAHVTFALRMVQIFAKNENNSQMPTLVLGFWPVYFPGWLTPWEPLAERLLTDLVKQDRGLATHMAGISAGLIFPHLASQFGKLIVRESGTSLNSLYEREPEARAADSVDSFVNEFLEHDLIFPSIKNVRSEPRLELALHSAPPPTASQVDHRRNSVPVTSQASSMPSNPDNSTEGLGHSSASS